MRRAMALGQIPKARHRAKAAEGIEPDPQLLTGFDLPGMRKAETMHYQIFQKKSSIYREEYYGRWYQRQQIS